MEVKPPLPVITREGGILGSCFRGNDGKWEEPEFEPVCNTLLLGDQPRQHGHAGSQRKCSHKLRHRQWSRKKQYVLRYGPSGRSWPAAV